MKRKKRRAVRLRFVKSSPLVKIAILVAVVLSTITLVALHANINNARSQYEAMRIQAAVLVETNAMLHERIDGMGTVDSVIQIAEEEWGLVLPGTTILKPKN